MFTGSSTGSLKVLAAAVLLLALPLGTAAAESSDGERERRFLFELGAGLGFVSVPAKFEDAADRGDAEGSMRMPLNTHLAFGYAVWPNTYAIAIADTSADMSFDLLGGSIRSVALYGLGARHYPRETGLVYGGQLGLALVEGAKEAAFSSAFLGDGDEAESQAGFGLGGMVGYDFADRRTGPSLLVGLHGTTGFVKAGPFASIAVYASLLWK